MTTHAEPQRSMAWAWILTGLIVAGIAVGIVLAIKASHHPDPTQTYLNCIQSQLRNSGVYCPGS